MIIVWERPTRFGKLSKTIFSTCHITSEYSANEYFSKHCSSIDVTSGVQRRFEYATSMCKFGNSAVSASVSLTGWAYEKKADADGFLLTVPESGQVTWETSKNKFESKLGAVFVSDQRETICSGYSENARYRSIYLAHEDLLRYLQILSDEMPKTRVSFENKTPNLLVGRFLTNITDTILSLPSSGPSTEGPLMSHLNESLICFALYNIRNTYSQSIRSTQNVLIPTPHCIKSIAEYIHLNFSDDLSVSALAVRANISIRSLQTGFKKYKGTTPMNYLREVRLVNAKNMIANANMFLTLKEVAFRCGFTNYYLFCKSYSVRFSESPADSMRNARKYGLLVPSHSDGV